MDNERIELLAKYLEIDPSEVEESYRDNEFETPLGDYLVLTEDEAYDMEKEDISNLIDDVGYGVFNINIHDFVTDEDWFKDWYRSSYEGYVEDIEYEDDDVFENRLIQECYEDADLLSDDDFEEKEDGEPDFKHLKETVDTDELKEKYVDYLVDRIDDYVEEFKFEMGEDEFSYVVEQNNLIDKDALIDYCINTDGVGHNIATYDGKEIELGDGFFAYRTN